MPAQAFPDIEPGDPVAQLRCDQRQRHALLAMSEHQCGVAPGGFIDGEIMPFQKGAATAQRVAVLVDDQGGGAVSQVHHPRSAQGAVGSRR
jgi:tetrahydromethanopterin S-methyltransferase subunit H